MDRNGRFLGHLGVFGGIGGYCLQVESNARRACIYTDLQLYQGDGLGGTRTLNQRLKSFVVYRVNLTITDKHWTITFPTKALKRLKS